MAEADEKSLPFEENVHEPERVEDEHVALEREILDPNTNLERLYEILGRAKELATETEISEAKLLEGMSDTELARLLKDGSTPYAVLEDIHRIIKSRRTEGESFPPEGE